MLGDLNPLGDGPCRSLADNGARVPKILPAAELEGFLTGLIVAMPPEPVGGAVVGDDVEEAQELTVEAPAGGDDAEQEGVLTMVIEMIAVGAARARLQECEAAKDACSQHSSKP